MKSYPVWKSLLTVTAFSLLFLPSARAQEAHPPHWAYQGEEGPAAWGKLDAAFATCSVGHTQSPIDIKGAKSADLPVLKFDYKAVPLNIIDNGHTIQVNYPAGSSLTVDGKVYTLKQFHFHHPSEEHINGHGYAMVAHLVHADSEGHLAVVAVLLTEGADNPLIASLWKNLPSEKGKATDVASVTVDPNQLLPADHGYFTFAGSLTTPPCSEGVTWYVLKHQSPISKEEVAAFAKIYPKNARPIQPANGREIRETK
jgi:carbonic anhydrase